MSLSSLSADERTDHRHTCGRNASRVIQIMVMNAMLHHYNRNSSIGQRTSLITSAVAPSPILHHALAATTTMNNTTTGPSSSSISSSLSSGISGTLMGATPVSRTAATNTPLSSSSSSSHHHTGTAGLLRIVIEHINHRRMRAKLRRLLAALTPSSVISSSSVSSMNGQSDSNNHSNSNDGHISNGDGNGDDISGDEELLSNQPKVRLHSSTPYNVFGFSIVTSDHRYIASSQHTHIYIYISNILCTIIKKANITNQ